MGIQIEKNVAISSVNTKPRKYPLVELEVGQSFFVEGKTVSQLGGSLSYAKLRLKDRKFISRTVDGGVRVWRVA